MMHKFSSFHKLKIAEYAAYVDWSAAIAAATQNPSLIAAAENAEAYWVEQSNRLSAALQEQVEMIGIVPSDRGRRARHTQTMLSIEATTDLTDAYDSGTIS